MQNLLHLNLFVSVLVSLVPVVGVVAVLVAGTDRQQEAIRHAC